MRSSVHVSVHQSLFLRIDLKLQWEIGYNLGLFVFQIGASQCANLSLGKSTFGLLDLKTLPPMNFNFERELG